MTSDGISYLDMGDAYLRGDWHTAINGYWNPLYAWLQALARLVFHPSAYWEYPLVHLVDYVIFALTAFAFEYMLQGLLVDRKDVFAMRSIAYSIFLWSTLELGRVFMVNPDMLVAATVYAAVGILLRAPKSMPIALGIVLAVGVLREGRRVSRGLADPHRSMEALSPALCFDRRRSLSHSLRSLDRCAFDE